MNYELNFSEDQLLIFREKEKLNYDENIILMNDKKKIFDKLFRSHIDIFIKSLMKEGILFYGFTINFPNFIGETNNAWKMINFRVEELLILLKNNIELIEFVYLSIERHGERQEEREKLLITQGGSTQNNVKNKKNKIKTNIYEKILDITKEEQKTLKGLPHLHGIIGIRSLIGENKELCNELQKFFVFNEFYEDILIKQLKSFRQIKGYWNYVIKEKNYNFHRFAYYSSFFTEYYNNINEFTVKYNFNDELNTIWGGDFIKDAKCNKIKGIGTLKVTDKILLLYLFNSKLIKH